jgi:hypothetical protein
MKTPPRALILLAGLAAVGVVVAGCGSSSTPTPPMTPAAYASMLKAQQQYETAAQKGVAVQQGCLAATVDQACLVLIHAAQVADAAQYRAWSAVYDATVGAANAKCASAMALLSTETGAASQAFEEYVIAVINQDEQVVARDKALTQTRDVKMPAAHAAFTKACAT